MTYTLDKRGADDKRPDEQQLVRLPRRSLQLQTGHVRFNYAHSIANEHILGERRISVTMRKELTGRSSRAMQSAS